MPPRTDPTSVRGQHITAERQLALAVVMRAFLDLFIAATTTASSSDGNPSRTEKLDTIRFLTNSGGPYARMREFWCEAASIDPDRVQSQARALLEGDDELATAFVGDTLNATNRLAYVAKNLAESRALYLEYRNMKPRPRTQRTPRAAPRHGTTIAQSRIKELVEQALTYQGRTVRQLNFDLDGEATDDRVRRALGELIDEGRCVKQGPVYYLIERGSVPQTSVAA